MTSVLHGFYHWLCGDRIRISSSEGQWLGLKPGQRVIFNDSLLVVTSREPISRDGVDGVRYGLADLAADTPDVSVLPTPPVMLADGDLTANGSKGSVFWLDCFCEND